jgi:hypothetical protein
MSAPDNAVLDRLDDPDISKNKDKLVAMGNQEETNVRRQ